MKIRYPSFKGGRFHKKDFLFVNIKSMQVGDDNDILWNDILWNFDETLNIKVVK